MRKSSVVGRVGQIIPPIVFQYERSFVAAVLGVSDFSIMFKHVLINIVGPVLVDLSIIMATAVLTESSLSYLGLGDPNAWSWGGILQNAFRAGHHFRRGTRGSA